MRKRYRFSFYMRIILTVVVYIIFFGYIVYSCINAADVSSIIFNLLIAIFIGLVGLQFEGLRICYDFATKRLIVDDRANDALKILAFIDKYDFFKTFKTSNQMMRILVYVDLRRFDDLKKYIDELEKEGINEYDVLITAHYGNMIAYGETGLSGKSNEAFKKLINARDMHNKKGKRYKGSYYFNWEVINGQHKNYEGDYEGAYRYLKDINEDNMNKREAVQYLLAKLVCAKHLKEEAVYNNIKERLNKLVINNQAMKDYIETI